MSSMAHLVGFGMCFLSALINGATTVITRPFDTEGALNAYERWHGTYTRSLPVILQCFLQLQTRAPRNLSSGRFFFCGGDSVDAGIAGSVCALNRPYLRSSTGH